MGGDTSHSSPVLGSPRRPAFSSRRGLVGAHRLAAGGRIDNNTKLMAKYAPDLAKDRFYVLLNDYHWVPLVILSGVLFAIGGLPLLLWGTVVQITFGLHATWAVNSATHMWGGRRFKTRDDSRNLWWVAMLSFGEGWHNNHHAHPTSARHGLAWYEFDISWISIQMLKFFGLAKAIRVAKVNSVVAEREAA